MINPFNIGDVVPIRDGFGKALIELGHKNEKIFVLDADLSKSTRSNWFAEKFPNRFIECGIAEQNMIDVAAGLSLMGKIPFTTTYGVFVAGRAFDQIRNTICFSNLNVKIIGSHGGLSVGADGGSHQAIEDIALMNLLPNMKVFSPVDANEAFQIIIKASDIVGPVFVRLAREATEILIRKDFEFQVGRWEKLSEGNDAYLLFHGTIGAEVMKATKILLEKKIEVTVINCSSIKPFDKKMLNEIPSSKPIFIIEEHLEAGGLGSIISTYYSQNSPRKLELINIGDRFGESGSPTELYQKFGFTSEILAERIRASLTDN